jgi:ABC-type arginine transport system permease subunit
MQYKVETSGIYHDKYLRRSTQARKLPDLLIVLIFYFEAWEEPID